MTSNPEPDAVLQLVDVAVRRGRRQVLGQISFTLGRGSVAALVGRNGAGKSSLLACLAGLAPIAAGSMRVAARDPWRERRALMAEVAYVPEVPDAPPTARVAALVAFDSAVAADWDQDGVDRRLARAGIGQRARAGELSRGQKTQLALTLALARRPQLLLLDDPTLGLDPVARRVLVDELIEELAERGPTVLLATHDLDLAERFADRLLILAGSKLVLDESVDTLRQRIRRISLDPSTPVPPELEVLAELGSDALGRDLVASGTEAGTPATLAEIVSAHLDPEHAR